MAPSAITETSKGSDRKNDVAISEQPKVHVHGGENMTPLEAISHGPYLQPGIPTFSTHAEHRRHILIHMAAVFRDWSRKDFTEGMSGHISVRDPEYPNYIWMNPLGKHYGLMTAGDFICLDYHTGKVVGGTTARTANAAGFLIHSEIHKARPDVHAVCHAHTIAGRAWSVFARNLDMLTQDTCLLHNSIAVYSSYGGIVFAAEEGRNIAASLGPSNKAAILLNHGLLSVGSTVDEAGFLFGLLDRSCAMQLQVEAAMGGNKELIKHIISDEEAAYNFKMASEPHVLYAEMQPYLEFELASAGEGVIERGADNVRIWGDGKE